MYKNLICNIKIIGISISNQFQFIDFLYIFILLLQVYKTEQNCWVTIF